MENPTRKTPNWKLFIPLTVLVLVLIGGFVWLALPAEPMTEVAAYLESDEQIEVITGNWLIFQPVGMNPDTGLILYTGGRVDPRAYAPLAYQIAAAGYLVVIPKMPFNLAVLNVDVASDVIEAYPNIEHWAVGGHSLGGTMAAQYVSDHTSSVDGLVLWAAYPPDGVDLIEAQVKAVTIYGSLDAGRDQMAAAQWVLPSETEMVQISGGNHEQFGWYGDQLGDPDATISRNEQQAAIIEATIALLASLKQ